MPQKEGELGTWTSIRLTQQERAKIAEIARRENRKMAQQIRQFIYEGIERRERPSSNRRAS
jgi:Spy/CpxP family protein refolding chaperone